MRLSNRSNSIALSSSSTSTMKTANLLQFLALALVQGSLAATMLPRQSRALFVRADSDECKTTDIICTLHRSLPPYIRLLTSYT